MVRGSTGGERQMVKCFRAMRSRLPIARCRLARFFLLSTKVGGRWRALTTAAHTRFGVGFGIIAVSGMWM